MTHSLHQAWLDAADALRAVGPNDEAAYEYAVDAQEAYDAWADAADELGLCLMCETHSPTHAFCEEHRTP